MAGQSIQCILECADVDRFSVALVAAVFLMKMRTPHLGRSSFFHSYNYGSTLVSGYNYLRKGGFIRGGHDSCMFSSFAPI